MLQVMLVDDKKSIVDGLEVYIDWKSLGFEVAAKATDAREAIAITKKQHIDLIITDIRMPEMTGLEMVMELGKGTSTYKYIFLSGYSEFEYAKWAIENRVSGYLLKPVNAEELTELLKKVRSEIEEEAEFLAQKTTEYLRRILDRGSVVEENTPLDQSRNLRYLLIKEIPCAEESDNHTDKIVEIIRNFNADADKCFIVKGAKGEVELVLNCEECFEGMEQFAENLKLRLRTGSVPDFVILVGCRVESVGELRASKESIAVLEKAVFYCAKRKVFLYESYQEITFSEDISDMPMGKMLEAVKNVNGEMFQQSVKNFRDHINQKKIRPDIVMDCVNKLVFDISDYVSKNGGEIMQIMVRWTAVKGASNQTCDSICAFLLELWEQVYQEISKGGRQQTFALDDVFAYIQENYSDETMSLQKVAQKYYITAPYLGKLIKEKTGDSFRSYLLRLRMEKAKNLLIKSNYTVYKIAHMVGFADANYFILRFQKSEDISPARYREVYAEGKNEQE